MNRTIDDTLMSKILLFSGPAICLLITPFISADPFNQSKMTLLVPCALSIFAIMVTNFKIYLIRNNSIFLILISLFILQLFFVLFFAPAPFNQKFYGTNGRNTGFLTYLSFSIFALSASIISSTRVLRKMALGILGAGLISAFYSTLQTLGLDPIPWANPYNNIIGFLGNPNFASSFLGIFGIVGFSFILQPQLNNRVRAVSVFCFIGNLLLIIRSNSLQGILVLGLGCTIIAFLFLLGTPKLARTAILLPFLGLASIAGSTVGLAMLNIGPLSDLIYKLSVRQRGYYWHAAIEMLKSHPFVGVGFDSYGDWYLSLRSANAAFHTASTNSNEAHNIFLNFGAVGGFPLLTISLLLSIFTLWSVFKYVIRARQYNWAYAGLVGAWLGYIAQGIISINQIGLAIWGWILMGVLVGIEIQSREASHKAVQKSEAKNSLIKERVSVVGRRWKLVAFAGLGGLLTGLILVVPNFRADSSFNSAIEARSAEKIIDAVLLSPHDNKRIIQGVQVLATNGLVDQSKRLLEIVLKNNPRDYNGWELVLKIENTLMKPNPKIVALAKKKMQKLNPEITIK